REKPLSAHIKVIKPRQFHFKALGDIFARWHETFISTFPDPGVSYICLGRSNIEYFNLCGYSRQMVFHNAKCILFDLLFFSRISFSFQILPKFPWTFITQDDDRLSLRRHSWVKAIIHYCITPIQLCSADLLTFCKVGLHWILSRHFFVNAKGNLHKWRKQLPCGICIFYLIGQIVPLKHSIECGMAISSTNDIISLNYCSICKGNAGSRIILHNDILHAFAKSQLAPKGCELLSHPFSHRARTANKVSCIFVVKPAKHHQES